MAVPLRPRKLADRRFTEPPKDKTIGKIPDHVLCNYDVPSDKTPANMLAMFARQPGGRPDSGLCRSMWD